MGSAVVACKRAIASAPKVKTGCTTCRIRKVKCDEQKPHCQKCLRTGRKCDGYQTSFKCCTIQVVSDKHAINDVSNVSTSFTSFTSLSFTEITPEEVDLLSQYFSTKTIFNVELGCNEEARQVLEASLSDTPVRYAISALRALRNDFEKSVHASSAALQSDSYSYGLQQYSVALKGLASELSSSDFNNPRTALLCCQIFISIEQVQGNFATMAEHIIRGFRIMHEYGARPALTTLNVLKPAYSEQLPLLDIFVVKLFAAPCKFADPAAPFDERMADVSERGVIPSQKLPKLSSTRAITPDVRTVLTKIATLTIEFLNKASQAKSVGDALRLRFEKSALLGSLETWLAEFELSQSKSRTSDRESLSLLFMRLFHLVLKVVLLGTLESSSEVSSELQTQYERLQSLATDVSERLKSYKMSGGTHIGGLSPNAVR